MSADAYRRGQSLSRALDAWLRWPVAPRWLSGIGAVWFLSALLPAFSERDPAAAFGANFVTLGVFFGLMAGSIALAIWLGQRIIDRTGQHWLAWLVGVSLFMGGAMAQNPLGDFFGVTSQLDSLLNSDCYVDWDGRSNPRVCD
jgi:hypothetical protein